MTTTVRTFARRVSVLRLPGRPGPGRLNFQFSRNLSSATSSNAYYRPSFSSSFSIAGSRSFSTTENDKIPKKNTISEGEDVDELSEELTGPEFEGIDSYTRREMQKRHAGIIMHEDGLSQHILPGEYVLKTNRRTGEKKMVSIERSLGYFWFMRDMKDTDSKPIVCNTSLIPIEDAQMFPPLNETGTGDLQNLLGENVSLPTFFTRDNRSMDPMAHCTLLTINYNDYGNKMLPSWVEPFEEAFQKQRNRVKLTSLTLNEGSATRFLKFFILRGFQNTVPQEKKDSTLLYFGNCPALRDMMRMHNNKTSYVYLLDGIGRVRWAGSGRATEEEIKGLIKCTKELLKNGGGGGDGSSSSASPSLKSGEDSTRKRKKIFNR